MQQTEILIHYSPSTFTTAECEIQFRTSEFDMQPVMCRIVGNALPSKLNVKSGETVKEEQEYEVKKTKTRTLLTNKKDAMRTSSRAGVRLEKLPEGSMTGTKVSAKAQSVDPSMRGPSDLGLATQDIGAPLTLKNHKVSAQEQNFIREYRHLEDLEREKGIKFF
jgi:hypothetical protein